MHGYWSDDFCTSTLLKFSGFVYKIQSMRPYGQSLDSKNNLVFSSKYLNFVQVVSSLVGWLARLYRSVHWQLQPPCHNILMYVLPCIFEVRINGVRLHSL